MNELLITYRGMIYPWQCDHMGHMNVMWYTGKFDEASWQLLARLGLTRSYMREQNGLMAAVQQETSYKRELRAGDIISIHSGILEIREKVIRFFHEMRNDESGELSAVTALTGVHMDRKTRRASPFPKDFVNRVRQKLLERAFQYSNDLHDTLPQDSFPQGMRFSRNSLEV